jgi:hypothetical protein
MAALYALALVTAIIALYLLTVQQTLKRCAPQNRTMAPGLVWLQIIPVFGLYWHFRNVYAVGQSLENEARARGIPAHRPHQSLGVAMGLCLIIGYGIMTAGTLSQQVVNGQPSFMYQVQNLRGLASIVALAGVITAALYWMRIARSSREICTTAPPAWQPVPQPSGPYPSALQSSHQTTSSPNLVSQPDPSRVVCSQCGFAAPESRYCPRCGSERES